MSILWAIGGFFIVLTPIVLIHELGHFWAARLSKIRVEEFGFGLPPRALKIAERNGTIYSINWIPLGGFVRPAGEDDPDIPGGLAGASKKARLFVLSAGAGANFVAAIFIFWLSYMVGPPAVAVSSVNPGSPAEDAGLLSGDVILEVEGTLVDDARLLRPIMEDNAGHPVEILISRAGELKTIYLIPRVSGDYDTTQDGPIGILLTYASTGERMNRGPIESAVLSLRSIGDYMALFVRVPMMLINGEMSPSEARPVSVVGISQIAGQAAEASATYRNFFPLLNMIAFINVALGLTNLLPLPALDGGRIMFVLVEAVRGRRVEPEREGMVHVIGMLFLLGLMVFMIVQDIVNPIIPF